MSVIFGRSQFWRQPCQMLSDVAIGQSCPVSRLRSYRAVELDCGDGGRTQCSSLLRDSSNIKGGNYVLWMYAGLSNTCFT